MKQFSILNFGLAFGLWWGVAMLLLGIAAALFNLGTALVQLLSSVYIGFAPTPGGIILGAIWGFGDGFIGGLMLAWFIKLLHKKK